MQSIGSTFFSHFLVGAGAAAAFECLKAYDLKHKLTSKKYSRLIRSVLFWMVTLGMLTASGFFAWVVYAERADVPAAQLAIAGIAARSAVREGLSVITGKRSVKLGNDERKISAKDLFQ